MKLAVTSDDRGTLSVEATCDRCGRKEVIGGLTVAAEKKSPEVIALPGEIYCDRNGLAVQLGDLRTAGDVIEMDLMVANGKGDVQVAALSLEQWMNITGELSGRIQALRDKVAAKRT